MTQCGTYLDLFGTSWCVHDVRELHCQVALLVDDPGRTVRFCADLALFTLLDAFDCWIGHLLKVKVN